MDKTEVTRQCVNVALAISQCPPDEWSSLVEIICWFIESGKPDQKWRYEMFLDSLAYAIANRLENGAWDVEKSYVPGNNR